MADPTPADPSSTNGEGAHEPTQNGAAHTENNTETVKTEGDAENTTQTNPEDTSSSTTTPSSTTKTTTDDAPTKAEAAMPSDEQLVDAIREIIKTHDPSEITLRKLKELLEGQFGRDLTEKRAFIKDTIPIVLAENAKNEENGEENGEKDEENEEEEEEEESKEETKEESEDKDTGLNLSKEELELQKRLMENINYGGARVTRGRASGKTPKPVKPVKPSKKRKSTDGEGEEEEDKPKKKKKGTSRANRPKDLSPALAEFLGESKMTRPDVVKKLHEYFKEHNLQNPKNKRQILFDEKLQQVFKKKTTDYFQLNTLLTKHLTDPGELV